MAVRPHPTKKAPGTWQIDYRPNGRNGKRERETFIGSREDAERRHTELCQQHITGHRNSTNPRIEEITAEYLEWLQLHRSPEYYKSMVWALVKIKPVFGKHQVKNITPVLFDEFKKRHKDTPAHCNQCIDYLKVIISWMVERGYARPLTFKVEKLRHFRNIPQPPDPGEFQRFLEEVKHGLNEQGISKTERDMKELLILLIYETGVRWVEARHLRWENLRADGRLYLGRTKTGEARYTVLSTQLIKRLWKHRSPDGYIFTNPKTQKPYTTLSKLIQGARERAGVNIKGTHGLRHALGTDMLEATGNIRATQDALGHSNIKTTEKYTHISIGKKQQALQKTQEWREDQKTGRKKVDSTRPAE